MTLTAEVVADLHAADGALADMDADSDVGFFSMSPASAEQVTVQIRTVLDRGWDYIALAYKGRAFVALGYPTWDAYVDARFGDFRIAVPREHRQQAVAALAGVRMSVRAIASLLGVGVGTVHREMVSLSGVPDGTPDGEDDSSTLGTGREAVPASASTSVIDMRHVRGDAPGRYQRLPMGPLSPRATHPAQNHPRPSSGPRLLMPLSRRRSDTEPEAAQPKPPVQRQESVEHGESARRRSRCRRRPDGGGGAGRGPAGADRGPGAARQRHPGGRDVASERPRAEPSAARVREVASCLRNDLTGIQGLIERLESVADGLHPR